MKLAVAIIAVVASAQAFCPTAFTRGDVASTKTQLLSEPEDDEGGGLDLNLEEMFDMWVGRQSEASICRKVAAQQSMMV